MKISAGEIIFREGDISDVAYMIDSGTVEIFREEGEVTERLALLEAGQMFGEMGPMDGAPRNASARALTDCYLTIIEVEADD